MLHLVSVSNIVRFGAVTNHVLCYVLLSHSPDPSLSPSLDWASAILMPGPAMAIPVCGGVDSLQPRLTCTGVISPIID